MSVASGEVVHDAFSDSKYRDALYSRLLQLNPLEVLVPASLSRHTQTALQSWSGVPVPSRPAEDTMDDAASVSSGGSDDDEDQEDAAAHAATVDAAKANMWVVLLPAVDLQSLTTCSR